MISSIIIDDEINSRKTLHSLIENYCTNTKVVGIGKSVDEGIKLIKAHAPDIIFLDIEMPFKNGFDLLSSFEEIPFEIIFTTAYSHYAIKAIKFSALDYLLKPINVTDLKDALEKVQHKKEQNIVSNYRYEVFLANIQNVNNQLQKMVVHTLDGFEVVELKDVIRCEGARNYTNFFFANKKNILVSKTLREFEDLLSDYGFLRVHQSHLINLNHVKKYTKGRGGYVEMSDGSNVDISRDKKDEFVNKFALHV